MNEHVRVKLWQVEDYRLLATMMLYPREDDRPEPRKVYRNQYQMIDALASTLMTLDRYRTGTEERLSFHIGNRLVRLGAWYMK